MAPPERAPAQSWDAVVLLQMGGPSRLEEIEPFLAALFADPDIIRLPRWMRPLQPSLARLIARRRTPKVRPRYEAMGGGSPLARLTDEQARLLQERLGATVHVAMRYTRPSAGEVVDRLRAAGARRVLLLPLYPHFSVSTTGSSFHDFARAAKAGGLAAEIFHVRDYGTDPAYLALVARVCEETLEDVRREAGEDVHLVFSAHGVPERYIAEGDTYQREVEASAALLRERLAHVFASVAQGYQSAVGPVKWIGPDTEGLVRERAAAGAKALVVAPLGFVSDHIETLYDMDTLYRAVAKECGIARYGRAPSFNGRSDFTDVLAGLAAGPAQPFEVDEWTS